MSNNNRRVFLYARKSTDSEDRQVYSIDHQLKELRELACREGFDIIAEFTEHRTAKIPGRPVFNNLLARMKKGEADTLLAWHPDRLARNGVDGGQVMHLLDTGAIVDLKFVEFWFEATPQGMLMLAIAFGMSKYYTDSLGQGIKRANRRRIQDGFWPRRPPLGYLFDHATRTIVLDPVRAPLVRLMFQQYATGRYTIEELRRELNQRRLVGFSTRAHAALPLSRSQYHRMLQHPFYAGVIRYKGELFEAKHEPIVSSRLFDKCQYLLTQNGKFHPTGPKPFLYRGMFTCAHCGCSITNETQKGHNYLRCTKRKGHCIQPYLREEQVIRQVARSLRRLVISENDVNWMIADLQCRQRSEAASVADDIKRIKATIAKFDDKQRRLTSVYVDGTMIASEFREGKAKILSDKRSWTERLTFLEKNRDTRFEPAIRFIRGLTTASIIAASGDPVSQRDFLKKTGSNLRMKEGRLGWDGRGVWEYVVASGFSGTREAATLGGNAVSADPVQSCSTWGTDGGALRTLLGQIVSFFEENPGWE